MKKNKLILVVALLMVMATTAMQSCISTDSNDYTTNYMSRSDASLAMMSMIGNYSGELRYVSRESGKVDSVKVNIYASGDSVLHLSQMPAKVLLNFISGNDKLKNAILEKCSETLSVAVKMNPNTFIMGNDAAAGTYYTFDAYAEMRIAGIDYSSAKDVTVYYNTHPNYRGMWGKVLKNSNSEAFYLHLFALGVYETDKLKGSPLVSGMNYYGSDSNNQFCSMEILVKR